MNSRGVNSRDEQVVRSLYDRAGRILLSKILYIVGREAVAEELMQEVFVKLWKSKIQFPHEQAAFSWLYKTAHNCAIDFVRSKATTQEKLVEFHVFDQRPACQNGLSDASYVEKKQLLRKAFTKLNRRQGQILIYAEVDGMSYGEIAEQLQISKKTVQREFQKITAKFPLIQEHLA